MSLIKSQIGEGELSGSLLKLGAINKTWKSRWFVLQGDKLYYFKTKDSPKAITFISVLHAHVRVSPEYFPNDYCFELVTDKRIFQLVAPSYMKMLQWMQAIKKYSTVVHENRLIEHAEEDIIAAQRTFSEAEDNNNNDNDNNNNNNSDGSLGFHGHESEDDDEFIEDFSNAKAMHLNSFVGSPGDLSDSDLDFNMAGSSPGIGSDCISSSPSSLGSSPGEYVSSSPNSDGTGNGGSDNTIVGSSSSTSAIQSSNSNGSRTVYICRSSPLTVTSSSSSRGVTTITTTTTTTTTRITTITRTTKTITTAASGIEEQCTPPLGPPSLMLGPSASSSPTFTDEADNG